MREVEDEVMEHEACDNEWCDNGLTDKDDGLCAVCVSRMEAEMQRYAWMAGVHQPTVDDLGAYEPGDPKRERLEGWIRQGFGRRSGETVSYENRNHYLRQVRTAH